MITVQIPVSQGFGRDGLTITEAGYVFRFNRAVSKVLVENTGQTPLSVGINEVIIGAVTNLDSAEDMVTRDQNTISAREALDKAVVIWPGKSLVLEGWVESVSGRRMIWNIWAVTDPTETTEMHGGVIGF